VRRHLISLIDGTRVSASNAAAYESYSNVFELSCLLQLRDKSEDGGQQIVFYTSGISSHADSWNPINLITGNSIWSQIVDQYINICSNYDFAAAAEGRPDKIYLFGFSRGAMAVRALASLIAEFGLLRPADVKQLPVILEAWNSSIGRANLSEAVKVVDTEVEFIGLFDSVMGGMEGLRVFNPVRFTDHNLPARCRRAVQILAIDENRWYFRPKYWDGMRLGSQDPAELETRMLRQVWMPGLHGDVGGIGSPIWGRASFLAMTYFIDRYTDLGLHSEMMKVKEANFRQSVDNPRYIIAQHPTFLGPFKRKPIGIRDANELTHPICDSVETADFAGREGYRWRKEVFSKRFRKVAVDEELKAYFDRICA